MAEDGKIDPSSPFYLGAGEPGNLITHVILKNDSYLAWSRIAGASLFGILLSKNDLVTCLKLAAGFMIWGLPLTKTGHDNNGCFELHGYPDWRFELKKNFGKGAVASSRSSSNDVANTSKPRATPTVLANAVSESVFDQFVEAPNVSLVDLKPEDVR
uniref:Retrotransposon Copia-like N-terminal domain-containing protein n=1 Tax=Chenopodium quinoa TaxID=63459 RepID=A0A803MTZ3_CHEQI